LFSQHRRRGLAWVLQRAPGCSGEGKSPGRSPQCAKLVELAHLPAHRWLSLCVCVLGRLCVRLLTLVSVCTCGWLQVVTGLHASFMRLVHECIEDVPLMKALGLSDTAVAWLQWSSKRGHSPVMGRMDFVLAEYDPATGTCVPKLLEYNGDTPGQ
jgi:hypothetical protein